MNFEHLIKRVERKKNEWSDIERIEMTQSALLHLRNCLNSLYLEHYIIAHAFRWTNSTFHVPVPDFAATSHEEIFKFAGADIIERFPEHFPDWNGHLIEGDIFPYYGLESWRFFDHWCWSYGVKIVRTHRSWLISKLENENENDSDGC